MPGLAFSALVNKEDDNKHSVPQAILEGQCSIEDDELYGLYRKYRVALKKEYILYSELSKYFTAEDNTSSIRAIREAKNDFELLRKMDAYESMLKMGRLVWVVYSYKIECISESKANLVIVAYAASTFHIDNVGIPSEVIVEYIKERDGWKIYNHIYDKRSTTRTRLTIGVPIDNFAWK